jgi:hypothetical protein
MAGVLMCLKHTCISPHDLVDAEKALSRTNFQELIQSLKSIAVLNKVITNQLQPKDSPDEKARVLSVI